MIKRILAPFFCALLFVSGPASAKETSPETIPGAKTVSVDEAKALFEKGVPFVDRAATPTGMPVGSWAPST